MARKEGGGEGGIPKKEGAQVCVTRHMCLVYDRNKIFHVCRKTAKNERDYRYYRKMLFRPIQVVQAEIKIPCVKAFLLPSQILSKQWILFP